MKSQVEVGQLMMERRKKLKLTQFDLAEALETRASAISNMENGNRFVPRKKVNALAKLLKIKPDELLAFQVVDGRNKGFRFCPHCGVDMRHICKAEP